MLNREQHLCNLSTIAVSLASFQMEAFLEAAVEGFENPHIPEFLDKFRHMALTYKETHGRELPAVFLKHIQQLKEENWDLEAYLEKVKEAKKQ